MQSADPKSLLARRPDPKRRLRRGCDERAKVTKEATDAAVAPYFLKLNRLMHSIRSSLAKVD
jgi:hypothetical protein